MKSTRLKTLPNKKERTERHEYDVHSINCPHQRLIKQLDNTEGAVQVQSTFLGLYVFAPSVAECTFPFGKGQGTCWHVALLEDLVGTQNTCIGFGLWRTS